ncbi:MAG: Gfo/Idh/MocA family oxidoreductase [Chloroflexi bacterium]|nr:Gfo/Idh/MocA family oxidoreductase [Chloroflexota bacterium]
MSLNPVIDMLGRRLRLAVIGGGTGSFIGAMHRQSARRDDRYQIVTGIFSSDQAKSKKDAEELGIESDRIYANVKELLDGEASRKDGIDTVAIMTPNDSHFDYSMWALERGIDVICDKPMTNTLEEAEALHKKIQETGLVFCLTHNYTGYPMVRQAKAMVMDGQLGTIRLVQVEYVQGGKADEEKTFTPDNWKFDPVRGGASRVMGDIGTHAHNLTRFITGLEVDEVSAEIGAIVPKRIIHDFGGALLRFNNGARGSFWVTQAAAGVENCLHIRVSGTKGTLEWMQEFPQALTFKPLKGPSENRTPNGPGTLPLSARCTRLVAGHPEGFPDGFANIYSDAAEAIAARRAGKQADLLALYFPNSFDGLMGVRFVDSVIVSSDANGQWTKC